MSEMSEIISLKMVVIFATSLSKGERLPQKLYIIICRNVIFGQISHKIHWTYLKQRGVE